jgi:hypothetical protein
MTMMPNLRKIAAPTPRIEPDLARRSAEISVLIR